MTSNLNNISIIELSAIVSAIVKEMDMIDQFKAQFKANTIMINRLKSEHARLHKELDELKNEEKVARSLLDLAYPGSPDH